jgi:hypothetical protein
VVGLQYRFHDGRRNRCFVVAAEICNHKGSGNSDFAKTGDYRDAGPALKARGEAAIVSREITSCPQPGCVYYH